MSEGHLMADGERGASQEAPRFAFLSCRFSQSALQRCGALDTITTSLY